MMQFSPRPAPSPETVSRHVAEQVSKGMALVFLDGHVMDIVGCYTTLWSFCDWAQANNGDDKPLCISIVFLPCGDPFTRAYSFAMTSTEWQARGLDREEAFEAFLPSIGIQTDEEAHGDH